MSFFYFFKGHSLRAPPEREVYWLETCSVSSNCVYPAPIERIKMALWFLASSKFSQVIKCVLGRNGSRIRAPTQEVL